MLDRAIAERGRYPAVNVLRSISRTMPACNTPEEQALIAEARRHLAVFEDVAELVRLGAYRRGTDAGIDAAVHYYPQIERFLTQDKSERTSLADGFATMREILASKPS